MKKLVNQKDAAMILKYQKQIGGYTFENSVGDLSATIECHHRCGNKITVTCMDKWEEKRFDSFTSTEQIQNAVEELIIMVTGYRGYEISKDDLGRWTVYNSESSYSRESDSKIIHVQTLDEVKKAIDFKIETGYFA